MVSATQAKRSPLPQGASWITPYITVTRLEEALPFYEKAFGFEIINSSKGEDGSLWHAELKYQGQMLMMGKAGAYKKGPVAPSVSQVESPMNLYLYCENVDEFYNHALNTGAKSVDAPEDMFWGDRMCRLQDPEGYIWCFATNKGPCQEKP